MRKSSGAMQLSSFPNARMPQLSVHEAALKKNMRRSKKNPSNNNRFPAPVARSTQVTVAFGRSGCDSHNRKKYQACLCPERRQA
jgi:hypothetical protein